MTLSASSNANGNFEFERTPAGRYWVVAVRDHEVLGSREISVDPQKAETSVDLRLLLTRISGRVRIESAPARGGFVTLRRLDGDLSLPTIFLSYRAPGIDSRQRPVTDIVDHASFAVDDGGRFEAKARLATGKYEVTYFPPNDRGWYHDRVDLAAESHVELQLDLAGVEITGKAEQDGQPANDVIVRLGMSSGILRTTRTLPDGSFTLKYVPVGSYRVEAWKGVASAKASLVVSDDHPRQILLTLREDTFGRLRVVARMPNGESMVGAMILLTDGQSVQRFQQADLTGTAEFDSVQEGAFKIILGMPGRSIAEGPLVRLSNGERRSADVRPQSIARTALIARRTEAGEEVSLLTSDGFSVRPLLKLLGIDVRVDSQGRVALPPLSEGRWQVRIGDRIPQSIDLEADQKLIELDD